MQVNGDHTAPRGLHMRSCSIELSGSFSASMDTGAAGALSASRLGPTGEGSGAGITACEEAYNSFKLSKFDFQCSASRRYFFFSSSSSSCTRASLLISAR